MQAPATSPISLRRVVRTWWPLAASWLLMSVELPLLSAVIARLPDPKVHLAAYGGVVFPLALIIEAPIIMLLAASTALSRDWPSYRLGWRFMMAAGALLTALHAALAFTPLYDEVVIRLLKPPPEVWEPARLGLKLMLPWTWAIAYRRFHQGVLIRFDRSQVVGVGTVVRLLADGLVLALGYHLRWPGVAVGAGAVAAGVLTEALFVHIMVRPILRGPLRDAAVSSSPLAWRAFFAFYVPLAMTSLLTLLVNPLGSGAMGRMPLPLDSLAAWPVVSNVIFVLRSVGVAYNEVVVALLDEKGAAPTLRRFAWMLSLAVTGVLLALAATPLSQLWFGTLLGIPADLVPMARLAVWLALPWPAMAVWQSWYQGVLLFSRRTRAVTEAVALYLLWSALGMGLGLWWDRTPGLYVVTLAFATGAVLQTLWLHGRARPTLRVLTQRGGLGSASPSCSPG